MRELILLALVLLLCLTGWNFWKLRCNDRTHKERLAIIAAARKVGGTDRYVPLMREFGSVDYGEHLQALERLKDARKLYGPIVREVMGWTE